MEFSPGLASKAETCCESQEPRTAGDANLCQVKREVERCSDSYDDNNESQDTRHSPTRSVFSSAGHESSAKDLTRSSGRGRAFPNMERLKKALKRLSEESITKKAVEQSLCNIGELDGDRTCDKPSECSVGKTDAPADKDQHYRTDSFRGKPVPLGDHYVTAENVNKRPDPPQAVCAAEQDMSEEADVTEGTSSGRPVGRVRKARHVFTTSQLRYLEQQFAKSHHPGCVKIYEMAELLDIPDSVVQVWFQNRRSKYRKQAKSSYQDLWHPTAPLHVMDLNRLPGVPPEQIHPFPLLPAAKYPPLVSLRGAWNGLLPSRRFTPGLWNSAMPMIPTGPPPPPPPNLVNAWHAARVMSSSVSSFFRPSEHPPPPLLHPAFASPPLPPLSPPPPDFHPAQPQEAGEKPCG